MNNFKRKRLLALNDFELDRKLKILNTDFNRCRKLTLTEVKMIKKAYKKGTSISSLAKEYNVHYTTIKYHVNDIYKSEHNILTSANSGKYPRYNKFKERVSYKRYLLASKQI